MVIEVIRDLLKMDKVVHSAENVENHRYTALLAEGPLIYLIIDMVLLRSRVLIKRTIESGCTFTYKQCSA